MMGIVCICLLGCAGMTAQKEVAPFSRDARAAQFFTQLDLAIEKYGVSDGSGFGVPNFPYLRSNRFLAAIKERSMHSGVDLYWAKQMLALDLKSRKKELANLPPAALMEMSEATGEKIDRDTVYQKTEAYALVLFNADRSRPDFMDILKKSIAIPDEYSSVARFLGLYPLAGIPVTIATAMAYGRYKEWHQTPLNDLPIDGRLVWFHPQKPDLIHVQTLIDRLYDPLHLDAFGLPVLTKKDAWQLAGRFAPAIYQDVAAEYDRIGKVVWEEDRVRVDSGQPSAYFYVSRNFLNDHPVLQLNYTFWYSERAGKNAPWIERGPLDGLSYRVTLDKTGKPVMVDIMNSCGCYYFFVPLKDIVAKVKTKPGEIAPLVPAWLPKEFPEKQMSLRVNSGWHQVQKVYTEDGSAPGMTYSLIPYENLESLPKGAGQRESVFSPSGIMKDSWRIEPYIFFSMGIADIGYMRQRGHHAIKMVGRGHFTDPDWYDRAFVFKDTEVEP
jgi:hypothetical protein